MQAAQLAIIGKGPAGLSTAIYAGRAGIGTLVLGAEPKVAGNYDIDNYFGFPETISGKELVQRGERQAQRFGVDIRNERVLGIHPGSDGHYEVKTEADRYQACAVLVATGIARIRPGIKNISEFEGAGVSYCVSCDGFFFRHKKVIVVGEGIFAANQALELTQYTPHVAICTQAKRPEIGSDFRDKLQAAGIAINETKIVHLIGQQELSAVAYENGEEETIDGLFVAMGQASASDFAYSLGLARNGEFIEVDQQQQTNLPGVFAAGDCVGRFLQISVAVGEGALAARHAIKYVKQTCKAH